MKSRYQRESTHVFEALREIPQDQHRLLSSRYIRSYEKLILSKIFLNNGALLFTIMISIRLLTKRGSGSLSQGSIGICAVFGGAYLWYKYYVVNRVEAQLKETFCEEYIKY